MSAGLIWALLAGGVTGALAAAVVAGRRTTRRRRLTSRLGLAVSTHPPSRPVWSAVSRATRAPHWLSIWLRTAGVPLAPDRAWRVWVGGGLALLTVLTAVAGIGGTVVAGMVAGGLPALALRARAGREATLIERALPSALETMARSLRSGGSIRVALAEAVSTTTGPLVPDLATVMRAIDHGIPIGHALDDWSRARPQAGVRLAVAALHLGLDAGIGLARNLDGVAATLHERAAMQGEVRTLATQARYSAVVLAAAPVVFVFVAAAIDPNTIGFLLRTPVGLACLVVGLTLDAAGALWMVAITRGAA